MKTSKKDDDSEDVPKRPLLTKTQVLVIILICKDMSNIQMAKELKRTVRTIESHKEMIRLKTGANRDAGIVMYAIRNRIICPWFTHFNIEY